MEKARDNVCTGLSARAMFLSRSLFLSRSHPLTFSFSLPRVAASCLSLSLLSLFHPGDRRTHYGLVRGSGGTKELVNGFIWIRSSPYLSHPPDSTSPSLVRVLSRLRWFTRPRTHLVPIFTLSSRYWAVFSSAIAYVEANKERWNESLGKRRQKVRRSLKTLIGKLIRHICQDCTEA